MKGGAIIAASACADAREATVITGRRQEIFLHIIWSTWDRVPLVDPAIEAWLWPMLGEEARSLGCPWAVVGGVADHVHVLCALPTTLAVAPLVQQMKGASARCASARGQPLKWQAGYGVFSVSPEAVPAVEAYVRSQPSHHEAATLTHDWE